MSLARALSVLQPTLPYYLALTHGIFRLLIEVMQRLSGSGKVEPVIQPQTPFGGGKTVEPCFAGRPGSLSRLLRLLSHSSR
jgi:hypothetical protein